MVQKLRKDQRGSDVQRGGHGQESGHNFGGQRIIWATICPRNLRHCVCQEWVGFWNNVISHGYSEPEALEELENLEKGEAWVDFDDERQT